MKRFYCVECKKMKRVRQWPNRMLEIRTRDTAINPQNGFTLNPIHRLGQCNRHNDGKDTR